MRMTKAGLQEIVDVINRRTGGDYELGYAYGRPRLERDGGAREVSPRLSAGQLADWMRAFLEGFDVGQASR